MRVSPKKDSDVLALFVGDLHLSHTPPVARSVEKNWYRVQQRYLDQLSNLSLEHQAPIVCVGDVVNTWKEPAELANRLRIHWMYSIAGQHDLPYHDYKEIERSLYWTLERMKKLQNLPLESGVCVLSKPGFCDVRLHAFPWGFPFTKCPLPKKTFVFDIALVHSYIWTGEKHYEGAPQSQHVSNFKKQMATYDFTVSGDNHRRFQIGDASVHGILNVGSFMRRRADEIDHQPSVGMLHATGKVTRHKLDVSRDKFMDYDDAAKVLDGCLLDTEDFIRELKEKGDLSLNFRQFVNRYMDEHKLPKKSWTRRQVLKALEKVK